jgi:hypothetical protein
MQFLKAVSGGIVAYALERSDLQSTATRVICTELLAGVVLRPLMMWCTPYYANKVRQAEAAEAALQCLARPAQQHKSQWQGAAP